MIYYSIKLNGVPQFVQEDIRISKLMLNTYTK